MTTAIAIASRVERWAREWLNAPAPESDDRDARDAHFVADHFDRCWGDADRIAASPHAEVPTLAIVLTTHARVDGASRVLRTLGQQLQRLDGVLAVTSVLVVEDRSAATYTVADMAQLLAPASPHWLRSKRHLGKREFWRIWRAAFAHARAADADYTLFLQDDLELEGNLLRHAVELARALETRASQVPRTAPSARHVPPPPLVLSLHSSADDERFGRWVFFPRRVVPGLPVRQTQWFDLPAPLMNRSALQVLRHRVIPISPQRFVRDPSRSSGVGQQLTRRLYARARIYQCHPSLVFHGAEPSTMNPEARRTRKLDNRGERGAV